MKISIKQNRELFLEKCKTYFEENGKLLSSTNGKALPLDKECHTPTWSIDVYVLSAYGICKGYFRNEDQKFTINNLGIMDLYLEDVKLLSSKFVTAEDIPNINKLKGKLKLI